MKIEKAEVHILKDDTGHEFLRFGPESWYEWYGMSWESVIYYNKEIELERLFQEYSTKQRLKVSNC